MFTDDSATPTRVETLLDLLRSQPKRRWSEEVVAELLQPDGLPGVKDKRPHAVKMIAAAAELDLVTRGKEQIKLTFAADDPRTSQEILCDAIDRAVLERLETEPYFAPFYSFLLGLGAQAHNKKTREELVESFREAYPKAAGPNPFNPTKLTGLRRWLGYAGLGWFDPAGAFQCNPYKRLLRRLPTIFGEATELPADQFMTGIAAHCPELDGGQFFSAVNTHYTPSARRCSLGVSRALVELHIDGVLRLHCPTDSNGWWIDEAAPPRDREHILSDRVDRLVWHAAQKERKEVSQ
jgi:hypothetical protein